MDMMKKLRYGNTNTFFVDGLLVDTRAGEDELRVGEDDGEVVARTLDVALGEGAEVDVGLDLGIHRDGYLAIAQGDLDVEGAVEEAAFQAPGVIVGDELVEVVLGGGEFGGVGDGLD